MVTNLGTKPEVYTVEKNMALMMVQWDAAYVEIFQDDYPDGRLFTAKDGYTYFTFNKQATVKIYRSYLRRDDKICYYFFKPYPITIQRTLTTYVTNKRVESIRKINYVGEVEVMPYGDYSVILKSSTDKSYADFGKIRVQLSRMPYKNDKTTYSTSVYTEQRGISHDIDIQIQAIEDYTPTIPFSIENKYENYDRTDIYDSSKCYSYDSNIGHIQSYIKETKSCKGEYSFMIKSKLGSEYSVFLYVNNKFILLENARQMTFDSSVKAELYVSPSDNHADKSQIITLRDNVVIDIYALPNNLPDEYYYITEEMLPFNVNDGKGNTALIIIVIVVILIIIAIIGAVYYFCWRKKKEEEDTVNESIKV